MTRRSGAVPTDHLGDGAEDGHPRASILPDCNEVRIMAVGSKKYRTILLFGMPGSGKGTQGSILGQLPALVHISCGEIFRKLPKYGELGREIVRYTSEGKLVPDELTARIWQRYIRTLEMQELLLSELHILVLDGMPRNYTQAGMVDSMLDVIQIFHLRINDLTQAKERLRARALRENRLDDINEDVINRRIKLYHEETEETLKFYDPALIYEVDAAQKPIFVLRDIVDRLALLSQQLPDTPQELPSELVPSGL